MHTAILQFLQYLQFEKRRSQHSVIAYKTDLEQFVDYAGDQFDISDPADITTTIIRSWLASLREKRMEPRSINRKLSAIKSFFRFLLKQGKVSKNPAASLESLKAAKKLPRFVAEDDLSGYFTQKETPSDWQEWNCLLIMSLLYQTGMRRAELIGLMERHVDYSAKHIKVLGKGNKERLIPVCKPLLALIVRYLEEKRKLIAGTGAGSLLCDEAGGVLQPYYVNKLVRKELSGVTTIAKKSPHLLRHSFATHLLNNGADINAIKELMGHASLAATQVYTSNSVEQLKAIFRQAHPKA